MRHFADRFVHEFERPLIQQDAAERPIRVQVRSSPFGRRFDILLAPGTGRRYPNLSDHKQNVEYDVIRVLHVLADESFVNGPLCAHAEWVVVPFRFKVGPKHTGVHMHILLLSAGGGGGNILRSVKASFRRDLAVTQKTDSRYAERLRRAVTARFLDTNEFALSDLPKEEQVLIGTHTTGRLGARHDPEVALQALNESRSDVEALFSRYSIIILIGTGGKGTGSGTMFPLAQIARQQKKLVIPIFVRPSFERHEVDKRHYDHAVNAIEQFDSAGIRLIEILNDRGYMEHDPQPQPIVWERMNLPIARGLRGLIYVLWDLSQVDPSDLSMLFAGAGRLRIGFAEIDPPDGGEPNDELVEHAARRCCDNPYYAFHKPAGTSLICIQGDWSNVVDAKIKGRLAAAMAADSQSPYSPLYARAVGTPKPWGVTALFAEYTGTHRPLDVDWSLERGVRTTADRTVREARDSGGSHRTVNEPIKAAPSPVVAAEPSARRSRSSRLERVHSRRSGSLQLPSIVPIPQRWPWLATAPHQTCLSTESS